MASPLRLLLAAALLLLLAAAAQAQAQAEVKEEAAPPSAFSSALTRLGDQLRWAYHAGAAARHGHSHGHGGCAARKAKAMLAHNVRRFSGQDGRRTELAAPKELHEVPAPNCNSLECPPYKLVHEESDFQIRRYRNATWVETQPLEDVSFMKATYRGFHSLFQYIEGENYNETHVPMTAPVLTSIVPSAGPFCSSAFVVRLYVPVKYAKQPPTPKSTLKPSLDVTSSGDRCVAIRKFGGFASDFNVASEASKLAASLERTAWKDVLEVDTPGGEDAYAIAQYNSPFEFNKRVNEVWVNIPVDSKDMDKCLPVAKPKTGGKKMLGIFTV